MNLKSYFKGALLLSSILLLSRPSFAETRQVEAFNQCVVGTLVHQFENHSGNRYAYSIAQPKFFYLKGGSDTAESQVIFIPGWQSYSDQFGFVGEHSHYELIRSMSAVGHIMKSGDSGISVAYSVRGGMTPESDANINAVLEIEKGLPFLTANRHVEPVCHVDAYGRKICAPSIVTYSNLRVVVPSSYVPKLTWTNRESHLNSQFVLDTQKYLNCLQSIR